MMDKAAVLRKEQEDAQAYLMKAMPVMTVLLQHRLMNNEPLTVMRPLRYQTSELQSKVNGDDDGFYNTRKSEIVNDRFIDVIKTITPGTQLILKSIDTMMKEFIFQDAVGNEHVLNFVEKNNLMTQTDIYEMAKNYLEGRGE